MSILSRLPFGKKPDPASAGRGPVTGCDLSHAEALVRPFAQDAFFRLRPPFSKEAAQLSLELADMTYTLELAPWKAAGWNDFSILIDDSLQSGLTHWETGDGLGSVINRIKVLRAKAALKEPSPVSQVLSALRQKEKSDTVKAVCMMHPLPEDKWLLAIGFMGTGKRFYDWFSNFRFTPEEGFHRGFNQLCESFQLHVEDIVFPAVAEAMGLEKLTLGQVLSDMRSLSSPFRLWMAGHSQGGAVMQVFTHRLMNDWGILPQNMVGYGFASPTVATGKFVYDPAAYPLYHILNSEDIVPRLGALLHLGLCMEYTPDEAFRQSAYPPFDSEEEALRSELAFFADGIRDTPTAIVHMAALMECLAQEKGADGLTELMTSWWAVPAVDRVLWRAGDKGLEMLGRLLTGMKDGYLALTKQSAPTEEIIRIRERLRPIIQQTSVRRLLSAMSAYAVPPHILSSEEGGAHARIVQNHLEDAKPFIWIKSPKNLPVRRYADWAQSFAPVWAESLRARRMPVRPVQRSSKLRMSYSAQRNA